MYLLMIFENSDFGIEKIDEKSGCTGQKIKIFLHFLMSKSRKRFQTSHKNGHKVRIFLQTSWTKLSKNVQKSHNNGQEVLFSGNTWKQLGPCWKNGKTDKWKNGKVWKHGKDGTIEKLENGTFWKHGKNGQIKKK